MLTLSAALAQQKDAPKKQTPEQKKIAEQAAGYVYPGAKNLEERNDTSSIYQGLLSTTDDLSKVAEASQPVRDNTAAAWFQAVELHKTQGDSLLTIE